MDETEIVRVAENLASRALNRVITQPTPNDSSNTDGGGAVHSGVEIVPGIFGVASVPTSAAMTAKQKASCGCGVDVLGDEHRDWLSRSSFRYSRSALARETTARVQRLAENPDDTMNLVRAALSYVASLTCFAHANFSRVTFVFVSIVFQVLLRLVVPVLIPRCGCWHARCSRSALEVLRLRWTLLLQPPARCCYGTRWLLCDE